LGLKSEAARFKRKNISATITADVKRFCHQIKTDEVFGTHSRAINGAGPSFGTYSGIFPWETWSYLNPYDSLEFVVFR
jgi:hypothetical protein